MLALVAAHMVAAVLAPLLVRRWGPRVFHLLALVPAAAAAWALGHTAAVAAGQAATEQVTWVASLGLSLAVRMDLLGWIMTLLVGGVGALVLVYCAGYFDADEPSLGRFAGYLTAFAGAMLGLVLSDDLLLLYVFWELTTVLSYLLIGHRNTQRSSRVAGTTALVVTTAGGLAMLAGIVLLGQAAGTYQLSAVLGAGLSGPLVTTAVVLLLVGAVTKSALVPFHFWLPAAMAAPTPVSAYLHAAAMVKAGVYLIARLAPAFSDVAPWRPALLLLGGVTLLLGGYRALRQDDLKLLLAYGTVAQLGFLTILFGAGTRNAALAGLTLLVAHALFKAALFLTVGAVEHATGTRDIRELSGVGARLPVLTAAAVLAVVSMVGLPPALGFVAKEVAFTAFLEDPQGRAALAVIVAGSVLTVAYGARFLLGAFGTRPGVALSPVHEVGASLVAPPVLLSVAGILGGVFSLSLAPVLEPYAARLPAVGEAATLGLWHGFTAALALSLVTFGAGLALVAARGAVARVQDAVPAVLDAHHGFLRGLRLIDLFSLRVTAVIQRGSLPLTLGAILVTAIALPAAALVTGVTWPGAVRWDTPMQLGVALVVAAAAVAATRSRRRLRAALLVGVTGYGVGVLFLLHGAPDLALTQVLVETVSIVLFVLVLRRLPSRFWDTPPGLGRWVRGALGVGVGVTVVALALTAAAVRTAPPASTGMAEAAYDFGGGKNVVNVILVDIRAWDTMGELSVLVVAATGVASLVFLRERILARAASELSAARAARAGQHASHVGAPRWLARLSTSADRSVILDVVTRLTFHTVVLYSLYLLFSGHNNPGGGFAAGLVAGLALTVRYLAGGREELRAAAPLQPGLLLGVGLFLSAGVGLGALLFGGSVLQSWILEADVPVLGTVKLVTSLFFDIGVYLVVLGLMIDILRGLGSALDIQIEQERQPEKASL